MHEVIAPSHQSGQLSIIVHIPLLRQAHWPDVRIPGPVNSLTQLQEGKIINKDSIFFIQMVAVVLMVSVQLGCSLEGGRLKLCDCVVLPYLPASLLFGFL